MTTKSTQDPLDEMADRIGSERVLAEAKKADDWITELTELVIAANIWGAENNYPSVDYYPQYSRARTIGKELVNWGGRMKILQTAHRSVKKRLDQRGVGQYDLNLLEFGWSGISGWQP